MEYFNFIENETKIKDISGKQQKSKLWLEALSNKFLTDIDEKCLEDILGHYAKGYAQTGIAYGKPKSTTRKRGVLPV